MSIDPAQPLFTQPNLLNGPRWAGMRVGLLGGSFNPPHEGHVHISNIAMQMMQLHCIWWVVTPQNPFKEPRGTLPFEKRYELCADLIQNPRIIVSDIERQIGSNRTLTTVHALKSHFPRTEFIWISGIEIARQLHTWLGWQDLLSEISMAHVIRPPAGKLVRNMPLRMLGTQRHIHPAKAGRWPLTPKTSYWILRKKAVDISSTHIRQKAG